MSTTHSFFFTEDSCDYQMTVETTTALELWPNDVVIILHSLEKVKGVSKCNAPTTGNQNMVVVEFLGGAVRHYNTDTPVLRVALKHSR